MGRLLAALIAESGAGLAANPANVANVASLRTTPGVKFADSQDSHGCMIYARTGLLAIAEVEGLPASVVDSLADEDMRESAGLDRNGLLAWLLLRHWSSLMDAGIVPAGYKTVGHCASCGPVWLAHSTPVHVVACPWCIRRKAEHPIPRPTVSCDDCQNYVRDTVNRPDGFGRCGRVDSRWHFPQEPHMCSDHEAETR